MKQEQDRRIFTSLIYFLAVLSLLVMLGEGRNAYGQSQWTTNGNNINNTNAGNVGVGTTSPGAKLTVEDANRTGTDFQNLSVQTSDSFAINKGGSISFMGKFNAAGNIANFAGIAGRKENSTDGSFSGYLQLFTQDGNGLQERLRINSVGNVGIGTTSPLSNARLDVRSPYSFTDTAMRPAAFFGSNDAGAPLGLAIQHSAYNGRYHVDLTGTRVGVSGNDIDINVNNGSGGMTVQYQGNVGIGTTSPTAKLDVNGDIKVAGNINAKYQDIAEWVTASHALPAGTVVVLNPTKSNQVMASIREYDTSVAGVISEKPGLSLGEAGKDKVLVATTGRVKVKVDATRAPIKVGDLLVTSDKEGVAMKSEPVSLGDVKLHRPGTLLGKALEPLEKGIGEILVLLSLQ